jgi:hypothetical protein
MKVVLVEAFQVNCPGCFFYALPQAISLYEKYAISSCYSIPLPRIAAFSVFNAADIATKDLLSSALPQLSKISTRILWRI